MKKTTCIIIQFCLFFTLPTLAQKIDLQQRSADLIGTWEIDGNYTDEKPYIIIKENNEFVEVRGEITKTSTWRLSDDGNTLYVISDDESTTGETVYTESTVYDVTKSVLILSAGNYVMVYSRKGITALNQEEIAERKSSIQGTWRVIELPFNIPPPLENMEMEEETEIKAIFDESGKLIMYYNYEGDKQQEESNWKLSKDGLYLITTKSTDKEEEKRRIISIDKKHFTLLDEYAGRLKFVRE